MGCSMNWNNVKKLRMERLGFTNPAESETDYDEIFKRLQPVSTEYFTEPGRPPAIRDRALFDDVDYNRLLRQNQDIIKARFQGNTISYVLRDEFDLYAAAFAKPISKVDDTMMELYTVLNQVGPMDKSQIIEELDLKGPVVTKILQKFQKAFMVYEIQPDKFGEQVWQTFESEWPEFDIEKLDAMEAKKIVITRFIQNMVAADFNMIKDWSRFNNRDTKEIISKLEENGIIETIGEGSESIWYLSEDRGRILNKMMVQNQPSVHVIHKADYIYRAHESKLKEQYKGKEILQFILIDGEIKGAVEGHWRIGPHNIENIIVDIPEGEAVARKEEIIAEVAKLYHPPYSNILRFNGEEI